MAKWSAASLQGLVTRMVTVASPAAIVVLSIILIIAAPRFIERKPIEKVMMSIGLNTGAPWSLPVAKEEAAVGERTTIHTTRLETHPIWIRFDAPAPGQGSDTLIYFPSRHTVSLQCWTSARSPEHPSGFVELGQGTRDEWRGGISTHGFGFLLDLSRVNLKVATEPSRDTNAVEYEPSRLVPILCKTMNRGPGRLSVNLVSPREAQQAVEAFHRDSTIVEAAILMLAVFIGVVALISKSPAYIIFAVWLVLNSRMAAISGGWDFQWLGYRLPDAALLISRKLTFALYYISTYVLFIRMFSADVKSLGKDTFLKGIYWSCVPLVPFALIAPYEIFLRTIWIASGLGIASLIYLLTSMLVRRFDLTAALYAIAIGFTLVASLYEVLSAALGIKALFMFLNSSTAALTSSLLVSIVVAIQFRNSTQALQKTQEDLRRTYSNTPTGLFSANNEGVILSCNPAFTRAFGAGEEQGPDSPWPNGAAGALRRPLSWGERFSDEDWERALGTIESGESIQIKEKGGSGPQSRIYEVKLVRVGGDLVEGSIRDISTEAHALAELQRLSNHDALTGVLNKKGLQSVLDGIVAKLKQHPGGPEPKSSLSYLHLDGVRQSNELHGHSAGDALLLEFATKALRTLPPSAYIARLSGADFVIVWPGQTIDVAARLTRSLLQTSSPSAALGAKGRSPCVAGVAEIVGSPPLDVGPRDPAAWALGAAAFACRELVQMHSEGESGQSLVVAMMAGSDLHDEYLAQCRLEALVRANINSIGSVFQIRYRPVLDALAPAKSCNLMASVTLSDNAQRALALESAPSLSRQLDSHLARMLGRSNLSAVTDAHVLQSTLHFLSDTSSKRTKSIEFVVIGIHDVTLADEAARATLIAILQKYIAHSNRICLRFSSTSTRQARGSLEGFVASARRYGCKIWLDEVDTGPLSPTARTLRADILGLAMLGAPTALSDERLERDLGREPRVFEERPELTRAICSAASSLGAHVALPAPLLPDGAVDTPESLNNWRDALFASGARFFYGDAVAKALLWSDLFPAQSLKEVMDAANAPLGRAPAQSTLDLVESPIVKAALAPDSPDSPDSISGGWPS